MRLVKSGREERTTEEKDFAVSCPMWVDFGFWISRALEKSQSAVRNCRTESISRTRTGAAHLKRRALASLEAANSTGSKLALELATSVSSFERRGTAI